MKVVVEVHKVLPAEQILATPRHLWEEYFYSAENNVGIYFHIYDNSTIPFYIGESSEMLQRNYDHISEYNSGMRYWLPKNPERLRNAECKQIDGYSLDEFYKPISKYNAYASVDCVGYRNSANLLRSKMSVYFARAIYAGRYCSYDDKSRIHQVEFWLQHCLATQRDTTKRLKKNEIGWYQQCPRKPDGVMYDVSIKYVGDALDAHKMDDIILTQMSEYGKSEWGH